MTDRLTADAQAALDAVRQSIDDMHPTYPPLPLRAILAALENLDARLKALEGK